MIGAKNVVKIIAFILHAAASLSLLGLLFGCDTVRFGQRTTVMKVFDWYSWKRNSTVNATCNSEAQCYRDSVPWADDEYYNTFKWNAYVLVFAFEWISASFALYYLRELDPTKPQLRMGLTFAPVAWNAVGVVIHWMWVWFKDSEGWVEIFTVWISFLVAIIVILFYDDFKGNFQSYFYAQGVPSDRKFNLNGRIWVIPPLKYNPTQPRDHDMGLDVLLRYTEYCITASLLYVAVLSIFVVEPPAWMNVVGFVSIFTCNCVGIPLHAIVLLLHQYKTSITGADPNYQAGYTESLHSYSTVKGIMGLFGVGKWRDFWVAKFMFLGISWFSLLNGMAIIWYVARGYLFNTALPTFVLVALWNLLLTYCSFGIVASVFYLFPVSMKYLDTALDILSVCAKVPIAVVVGVAFLQMPGGGCKV